MLGEFLGEVLLGAQTDFPNVAGVADLSVATFGVSVSNLEETTSSMGRGDGTCLLIKHGTYHG